MIADLKSYPEYKESGQEWLGQVPAHWEVRRTKFLLREMDSRSMTGKEQLLRVSQYTGVTPRRSADGSDAPDTRASSLKGYKLVCKNDLVINIMLAWNGSMGVSKFYGIVSPAYCVYRVNPEVMPWYFHELLRLPAYKGRIKSASTGVVESRLRLYSDDLGCIEALLPPPAEQAAIVRFLDYWNGRLEKAIRAKRRVITLLQEQKQAIIHQAVTRGLDPNVKLKDSGIPWLGEIPEHWESMPNRANLKIRKKLVGDRSYEYTLLSLTMRGVIARDMVNPTGKFPAEFNTYQEVRPGDLIFCLFDIDETPRGVGISRLNGMITGAYTVFESRDPEIAEFLYLHYLAMDEEKCLKPLYTGLRKTIPKPRFLGIKTPIPPPDERITIVRHIQEESVRIDRTITRYEREIALLREYRTRLTADVVTGKLDVRAAAAQLPEKAEESAVAEPEIPEEEAELEEVEE